jgi:hypothetical protein
MRKRFAPEKDAGSATLSVTRTRRKSRVILIYGAGDSQGGYSIPASAAAKFFIAFYYSLY